MKDTLRAGVESTGGFCNLGVHAYVFELCARWSSSENSYKNHLVSGIFISEFHFGRRGTRYSGNREECGYSGTGLKVAMLCRDLSLSKNEVRI